MNRSVMDLYYSIITAGSVVFNLFYILMHYLNNLGVHKVTHAFNLLTIEHISKHASNDLFNLIIFEVGHNIKKVLYIYIYLGALVFI